jgi:anaerobic magnesium-protoporphyrin IX monomethyl ester cyclase
MNNNFRIGFICPGYESLSIEHLSAGLRINGFQTKLFLDPLLFAESGFLYNKYLAKIFSYRSRILRGIMEYRPDLICFSVISDNFRWAIDWGRQIKKYSNIPIIFGGIHPSSVPDKVITETTVDYVCVGEGDEAIVDLAKSLANGGKGQNIKNIYAKINTVIYKNSVRPLIRNLDNLPFPDKDLFYESAPIFKDGYLISTSRGCPYSCSYCCNNVWKQVYSTEKITARKRSVENVIDELRIAKQKYGIRHITFADETFNADRAWLESFLFRYKREIGLPFFCYVFPDLIDENIACMLRDAGCYKVQMGVQVIDETRRRSMLNRYSRNEYIARAIDGFRKNRIYVTCDTIFGFPGESLKEVEKLAFFYSLHMPDHIEIFWLRYFPKTKLTDWASKKKYITPGMLYRIESGLISCGIVNGNRNVKKEIKKIIFLFYIFPFIPFRARNCILIKHLYFLLPSFFSFTFLYIVSRLFRNAKFDLNVSRTFSRYLYFMMRFYKRGNIR